LAIEKYQGNQDRLTNPGALPDHTRLGQRRGGGLTANNIYRRHPMDDSEPRFQHYKADAETTAMLREKWREHFQKFNQAWKAVAIKHGGTDPVKREWMCGIAYPKDCQTIPKYMKVDGGNDTQVYAFPKGPTKAAKELKKDIEEANKVAKPDASFGGFTLSMMGIGRCGVLHGRYMWDPVAGIASGKDIWVAKVPYTKDDPPDYPGLTKIKKSEYVALTEE